jgi:hypothetical protein
MRYIMPPSKEEKLKAVTELRTEEAKISNRSANRKLSATDVNLADIDGVMQKAYELIGATMTVNTVNVSPAEIDLLAEELLAVRDAKDLIEGRESALKEYATEIINKRISMDGDDPAQKSGFLVSPENGIKISKEVTGGKLNIEMDILKDVLDESQFKSVTNKITTYKTTEYPDGTVEIDTGTIYEMNEDSLQSQLSKGNIGMEQIIKATVPGKTRTGVYVRKLK